MRVVVQGWKFVKSLIYSRADNNLANTLCVENKIISKILDSFLPLKKLVFIVIYVFVCKPSPHLNRQGALFLLFVTEIVFLVVK